MTSVFRPWRFLCSTCFPMYLQASCVKFFLRRHLLNWHRYCALLVELSASWESSKGIKIPSLEAVIYLHAAYQFIKVIHHEQGLDMASAVLPFRFCDLSWPSHSQIARRGGKSPKCSMQKLISRIMEKIRTNHEAFYEGGCWHLHIYLCCETGREHCWPWLGKSTVRCCATRIAPKQKEEKDSNVEGWPHTAHRLVTP